MNFILYTVLTISLLLNALFIHVIIKAFKRKKKMIESKHNNAR